MASTGEGSFLNSPDFPFHDEFKDWFLANCVWFDSLAGADEYPQTKHWRKRRPRIDQSFGNAQQFCLNHGESRFFEGVMLEAGPAPRPVLHAWVVMQDERVVDFALDLSKNKRPWKGQPPIRYVGVEIPTSFLASVVSSNGYSQPVAKLFYTAQQEAAEAGEAVPTAGINSRSPLRRRRRKSSAPQADSTILVSEN